QPTIEVPLPAGDSWRPSTGRRPRRPVPRGWSERCHRAGQRPGSSRRARAPLRGAHRAPLLAPSRSPAENGRRALPPFSGGRMGTEPQQGLTFILGRARAGDFPIETAGLASPATDSTADAERRHSFDVAVVLSPSARERLRPVLSQGQRFKNSGVLSG